MNPFRLVSIIALMVPFMLSAQESGLFLGYSAIVPDRAAGGSFGYQFKNFGLFIQGNRGPVQEETSGPDLSLHRSRGMRIVGPPTINDVERHPWSALQDYWQLQLGLNTRIFKSLYLYGAPGARFIKAYRHSEDIIIWNLDYLNSHDRVMRTEAFTTTTTIKDSDNDDTKVTASAGIELAIKSGTLVKLGYALEPSGVELGVGFIF